eukprot:CAMPEP_0202903868 /NCGR_PEP_ID=MMETSP1392-20130828/26789_1 /ASSEMBLY_ACC=CAM_ASM_000868 /TAXON_ID=225041 /ORGANISM="Chlamydomonas chlamydogama, Strain SAG 11-48b" /LENGTH=347 /DNA_ID=CAMNT_0049591221 /DNA_START=198 /DNA_END=1241 /DNA_ORIENTATION=+
MKAALVSRFGEVDPAVSISTEWPRPKINPGKGEVLVRILACSTAAGDVHVISGRMTMVVKPPSMPYIPGKDVCGIVEEVDQGSKFKVGDCVVGSGDMAAWGGMAEYMVLRESKTCLKPPSVDILVAASCPDSSSTAFHAVARAKVRKGDRVLILGGSGGVGSSLLQLVKHVEPSFLAATSTQAQLLRGLGADRVIDYKSENWWEVEEFARQPFDVIIDCVGGGSHYSKARRVLKSSWAGGRFVAVVGDDPKPLAQRWYQLLGFAMRMLWKPMWTTFCPWVPAYLLVMSSIQSKVLSQIMDRVADGRLRIMLDPASPHPFTAEGVRKAFMVQASGHAHGKVVVKIADP